MLNRCEHNLYFQTTHHVNVDSIHSIVDELSTKSFNCTSYLILIRTGVCKSIKKNVTSTEVEQSVLCSVRLNTIKIFYMDITAIGLVLLYN